MQQAHKEEFKDLLKRNTVYTIWTPVCTVLVAIVLFVVAILANHLPRVSEGISSLDYRYVLIAQEGYEENSFCRFIHLSTISKDKNFNTNVYMQTPESNYRSDAPMYVKTLKSDEIALSEKLAEKIKASIGDIVMLELSIIENPVPYKVVGIFEYVDDYYEFNKNTDFSVCLIGYNSSIYLGQKNEKISFLNYDEKEKYLSSGMSYTGYLDVNYERKSLSILCLLRDIVIGAAFCILTLSFMCFEKRSIEPEWNRYHLGAYSNKVVKAFHRCYGLFCIVIPSLVNCVLLCVCTRLSYIWCGIIFMGYFLIWVRYSKYEKAI